MMQFALLTIALEAKRKTIMSHELIVFEKNGYKIIIAGSRELQDAASLIQTRYAWRGYSVTFDAISDGDITFCARKLKTVIATASLRFRGKKKPLLCEKGFKAEVRRTCRSSEQAAEIIRFAAEPNHISVIATLLHVVVLYAVQSGVKHFLAEINPRHARIYRDCFGFKIIGAARNCERAGAPAVLMHTNPVELSTLISTTESGKRNSSGIVVYKLEPFEVRELLSFFERHRAQVPA